MGSQSDFEYDALAQLSFADADAFDTFWALCQQPGNAERIAADEEQFLDRPRCKYFISCLDPGAGRLKLGLFGEGNLLTEVKVRVVVLGERASTSR